MTDKFTICNTGLNGSFIKENGKIMDIERVVDLLNEQHEQIEDLKDANVRCCNEYSYFHKRMMQVEKENEQLKQQLKLKEAEERINCRYCIYFILGSSSDSCLKREDIGYKGTCIDGMDYHYLAKNCPYYEKGDVE